MGNLEEGHCVVCGEKITAPPFGVEIFLDYSTNPPTALDVYVYHEGNYVPEAEKLCRGRTCKSRVGISAKGSHTRLGEAGHKAEQHLSPIESREELKRLKYLRDFYKWDPKAAERMDELIEKLVRNRALERPL